jgi:predicted amidohydrolase YtcJ
MRIGPDRIKTTYAFRSLIDAGARMAFGSDWTVAPLDPILGIYAAVTRRTLDGKHPGGWVPDEKITAQEALRAYTAGNAYGMYAEKTLGKLVPGSLADIVVLDRDLTRVRPETIEDAKVLTTVVGGKVVYSKQ